MKATEPLQCTKICFRILCFGWKTEICSEENPNPDFPMESTFYDMSTQGQIQDFFLGGGALISCSTSTPINHIVFFLQNTSCIRKPQVISGGGSAPATLQLNQQNHEHLKYFRNVYCVKTNQSKHQDMQKSHKTAN